jgi:4-amino-4-deoxy-L-arabinose transferase-like glycosyltransferase
VQAPDTLLKRGPWLQSVAHFDGTDGLTLNQIQSRESGEPSELIGKLGDKPLRYAPVLSLAFVLRILAAAFMFRVDPRIWFYNQASELTCLAYSVLSGRGLSSPFGGSTGPSAFLAPGYPLLVSLVYHFFGVYSVRSAVVLTSIQVLFGVLIVLMTMLVAQRLFGNQTAYIAGTFCAISPTMVWLPTLFWETSLSTLLLIGVLAFAPRCVDRTTHLNWIAIGVYCALAMLVNPALLITFAAVGLWAAASSKRVSRGGPLVAAATCAILFSIWPIRNALALHAFVPLRSNLGYEFWQGNRPGSRGLFTPDLYLNANREEYNRYASMGELPYMHEKSAIAVAVIKADPLRFMRLSLKRFAFFWTALGGHGISRVVIAEIMITSLLSIAGLLMQRKTSGLLLLIPLLIFPLPYYVTHPDFRFRLLLEPITLILTAWLLQEGFKRIKLPKFASLRSTW